MFTEEYFSKWFDIISEHDARTLWNDRDRSFLVLNIEDGTDRYADCFENLEEREVFLMLYLDWTKQNSNGDFIFRIGD